MTEGELFQYEHQPIRIRTLYGDVFEGRGEVFPAEYGMHEFGREEEGVQLGEYILFGGELMSIEKISEDRLCGFYGAEAAPEEVRQLYRDLMHAWCRETCAPRMRPDWSEANPTLGQCSITSFLVQDLLGGKVCGVPLPEGGYHCFNVVGDFLFDLTSEQFGDEELDYDDRPEQLREVHFADADKLARYELLKRRLLAFRAERE